MKNTSLGFLRLQCQQRSDMENNPAISTSEWNQYISQSHKELYDMLVGAYGNDYYMALPYQFNASGSSLFNPLPDGETIFSVGSTTPAAPFYKLLGVDLQYSASPTGWITLLNFEFLKRNQNVVPNSAVNYLAQTTIKYRLAGNNIEFNQIPSSGQLLQAWYIPQPTNLVWAPCVATTIGSNVLVASDITGLSVGMSIYASSSIPDGSTITAINTTTKQVTISNNCLSSVPILIAQFWSDATLVDGIAGWEEYIIIDAAIKAGIKQENPVDELKQQRLDMKARIESMAEGRDAGQAHHTTDALSINGWNNDGCGFDDSGFGGLY